MNVYLNTFKPICITRFGRKAITTFGLNPFIDGSCRREPDFENPYPAITQLCRPSKLVPRLSIGDLVIYLTIKGNYGDPTTHWKFIAILEVISIQLTHCCAANYYLANNIPISQNIICNQTIPFPIEMTHGSTGFKHGNLNPYQIIKKWNWEYIKRAINFPEVAITRVWKNHLYLNNPPKITHEMMMNIFNRISGTQTPPKLKNTEWENFKRIMNI
jgi:hypothetical protein